MADTKQWKIGDLVTLAWAPKWAPKVWRVVSYEPSDGAYALESERLYTWAVAYEMADAPPGAVAPPVFRTEVLRAE